MEKAKKERKAVKIVGRIFTGIIALIAIWLVVCFVTGNIPMLFGYGVVRIQSGSMEPAIHTGDFILIKKTPASDIKVGDIITFKSEDPAIYGKPNTHRVEEIITSSDGVIEFVTKGDANLVSDTITAKADRLYGKYVSTLTAVGAIFKIVSKPYVFWPVILIIFGLIAYSTYTDIKKETAKSRDKEIDALVAEELKKLKEKENQAKDGEPNDEKGGNDNV